ncbi:MAG: ABC-2 family transporter protein [Alphaproteobacteria bacterium]|nr:ABC-2 family transporter protein [Alphaproteobacteria bacterium]MBV9905543.1 ABC-2 family transporter protein [Alphaproteobacteria bacterium]
MPSTTQTARADLAFGGTLAAAWSAFALGVRRNLANWPILMGRALFYLVAMTVLTALWDKVASQRLAGTLASSLPNGGLMMYVGVTEWITLSVASIHLRLEDDIRMGLLEPHLLRPKPYLVQKIAESLGDTLGRLIGIGAAALLALVATGHALPPLIAFVYVAILGPLGAALGVLIYTNVGLAAFWVRRVLPPYIIVQKIWFLLGGLFAPISLYPLWFYHLAVGSPFAASIFLPGNQMIAPSATAFGEALIAQIVWIVLLSGLTALIWRAGLRKVLREGV